MRFAEYIIKTNINELDSQANIEFAWHDLCETEAYGLQVAGDNEKGEFIIKGTCFARTQNECNAIIKELKKEIKQRFHCTEANDIFVGSGTCKK